MHQTVTAVAADDGAAAATTDVPAAGTKEANRARAERRRSVRNTVREHRERLALGTTKPVAFDRELLLTYARNRVGAALATPLLILLVAGTALLWMSPWRAAIWAGFVVAADLTAALLCRRYMKLPVSKAKFKVWRPRFVAAELASGVAWASLFVVMPLTGPPAGLEAFQFATMLLAVAASTSLASTMPAAAAAGAVPITLALVGTFVLRGGLLDIALAAVGLAAMLFFTLLSTRLRNATLSMLEYREEKDLLIAELSTAKAISDEARRRAEEANLAKSRFLATMSHELRTPLNAILGFSEIIKKEVLGPVGNDSYREYVGDIHDSGTYLLNLINEILDLSRIEAGKYELHDEPVDLMTVVGDCIRLLQLKAKAKEISVETDFPAALPRLWADERAARQVVLNLLSNALKFTPTGGRVDLRVGIAEDGGQFLSVTDNGPGIPEEEISLVLSSFGQGSLAISSAERGAGLGLTIVQALMKTHDGRFELTSKLRVGTTATATFPAARSMEALPPVNEVPRAIRA